MGRKWKLKYRAAISSQLPYGVPLPAFDHVAASFRSEKGVDDRCRQSVGSVAHRIASKSHHITYHRKEVSFQVAEDVCASRLGVVKSRVDELVLVSRI